MKKEFLIILLLFCWLAGRAQHLPDFGFNKVRITDSDKTVQAELIPAKSLPQTRPDLFYYWYGSNLIHSTQGGFSGKLLNGNYSEYYLNKNLKAQGSFKNGLKDRLWRDWIPAGSLIDEYTWKNGLKDGFYKIYDEAGKLREKGTYKKDVLDGKTVTYNNGVGTVIYYTKGNASSHRSSIWHRLNIFKRKHKLASN